MKVAVVTFDGFNELDSLVAAHIINRVRAPGWRAEITGPSELITSMNGVVVRAQQPLEFAAQADAVIIGSGRKTREVVDDPALISRLQLDPARQLIASQCSGALVLIRLGLVQDMPVCTDRSTQASVESAGYRVLEQPFHASGRVATAGGCFASHYIATWMIWVGAGRQAAVKALSYVLPRGEEQSYTDRALGHVEPFVIESELATILQTYEEGLLSNGEAISRLVDLAGLTDVDAVVSAVPAFLRGELTESLFAVAAHEGPYVLVSGGIYEYELETDPVRRREKLEAVQKARLHEQKQFDTIIRPKIRAWAQRHASEE